MSHVRCPNGAPHGSLGHRPRYEIKNHQSPVGARYIATPLQGSAKRDVGTPEAMPQADMRGAVGAGEGSLSHV
jgi:hypothetical protein